MFTLTRLISWRYLRRHGVRMVLAMLSIALGVATLVASQTLNRSTLVAFSQTSSQLAGKADLQITQGAAGGVRLDLLEQVRSAPAVSAAVPFFARRVKVRLPGGLEKSALLLGVEVEAEQAVRDYGMSFQQTAEAVKGLLMPQDLLVGLPPIAAMGESLSDKPARVEVLTAHGWKPVLAALPLKLQGAAAAAGGNLLILPIERALTLTDLRPGQQEAERRVNRIDIVLRQGISRQEALEQLQALVGEQGNVHPPRLRDENLEDVLAGVQVGLTLGATVALFVGMFLVYNTLAVVVAERRHDIGILRALGGTRNQIRGLFAMEALILGFLGATLGVFGGLILAWLSLGTVNRVLQQQFAAVELRELSWTPQMLLIALCAGVGASLIASLAPASAAAAEPPSDALRRVPTRVHSLRLWAPGLAAVIVLLAGWLLLGLRAHLPHRVGTYASICLVLLAFMLAMPVLARIGVRIMRPLTMLLGTSGRLAADDLARAPGRTGLTVGALAMGLAMTIETAGLAVSTEVAILDWLGRAVRADLLVTSGSAITGGGQHTPMAPTLEPKLADIPGVREVLPVRLFQTQFRKTRVLICALHFEKYRHRGRVKASSGDPAKFDRLMDPAAQAVLVSDNFAVQHNYQAGDQLELKTAHGIVSCEILGTVPDYSWNRGTIFMDLQNYRSWYGDPLIDSYDLYLEEGSDPGLVRQRIQDRLGADHELVVLTNQEFRGHIQRIMDQFYALAYANAVMAMAVAFLGVANTLAISVLQRWRELGLLRAVGATRWQVAWSVLAQALFIALLGLALGTGLGVVLEKFVLHVLMVEETGFYFPFLFPGVAWMETALLALVGALVAAALPALRAAWLPISEAVAYE